MTENGNTQVRGLKIYTRVNVLSYSPKLPPYIDVIYNCTCECEAILYVNHSGQFIMESNLKNYVHVMPDESGNSYLKNETYFCSVIKEECTRSPSIKKQLFHYSRILPPMKARNLFIFPSREIFTEHSLRLSAGCLPLE